jgi:hypothetical protein
VEWRTLGTGNSTGGEWLSSLSCLDSTDKSYVVASETSLTRQRVGQFRVCRRNAETGQKRAASPQADFWPIPRTLAVSMSDPATAPSNEQIVHWTRTKHHETR